jgi:hypothetical protein
MTLSGEGLGDGFGTAVGTAGDVNGDGFADVIVGAPDYSSTDPPNRLGRVYVYFGGRAADSTPDLVITGETALGSGSWGLGRYIGSADLNHDGFSDVILGESAFGGVRVFFGGPSLVGQKLASSANLIVSGSGCPGPIASADVNGDGTDDLILGDQCYRVPGTGSTRTGRAYVFFGGPLLVGQKAPSTADVIFDAASVGDGLGYAVAAGDVNGDGRPDVIVSSFNKTIAYIFFGGLLGGTKNASNADMTVVDNTSSFGFSLASADLNSDGFADVIVGSPALYYDGSGYVSIFFGGTQGGLHYPSDVLLVGEYRGFGQAVSSAGDVDGDGFRDLILGDYLYYSGLFVNHGRAYVLYGANSWTTPRMLQPTDAVQTGQVDETLGWSVSTAGDVNGDGRPDVIIGGPSNSGTAGVGHAYVISFPGVPTAVSLVTLSTEVEAGRVRIRWYAPGDDILSTNLFRRTPNSDWALIAHPTPDMSRNITYEDDTVAPGITYGYRLEVLDITNQTNMIETWVTVPSERSAPSALRMEPPHPNPSGGRGELSYGLPKSGRVRLTVYDVRGRRVTTLFDRIESAGWHSATWDGRDGAGRRVTSGIYFVRLEGADGTQVQKIVIAK